MADGHAKVSSIDISNTKFNVGNVNLDDIRTYKNNNTLVYDGKRLKCMEHFQSGTATMMNSRLLFKIP